MYVEFTKHLSGRPFNEMRIALKERPENLLLENISESQQLALNRLASGRFLNLQDYMLLHEMALLTTQRWNPGQQLLVYFMGGQPDICAKVLQYAQEWSDHCSITFLETKDANKSDLRVSFINNGSWSYIGTTANGVAKTAATINFGWLSGALPESDFKQVVLHEFGHALGLIHEHQSPAVKLKWDKPFVYNYFAMNHGWSKADVERNIFYEFETTNTQYSALDPLSIMGYHIPPEFTLDNQVFPMNYVLSAMDKSFIGQIYP